MELVVLGSNSLGNGYVLQGRRETLLLEAGVRISEVKKALRWQMNGICGAIVTHSHNDHAAYVKDYIAAGIRTLALPGVFEAKGLTGRAFTKAIQPHRGYALGGFKVYAFPVIHDVPCVGYVIEHAEMGRMLFVTDTMMLEYTFPKMNHILLEANYADDILERRIEEGEIPAAMRPRLLGSHMELETTKGILRANDLSCCNEIVLIHISDGNSDEGRFVRECSEVTGLPVYAARPGMRLDLSINPY